MALLGGALGVGFVLYQVKEKKIVNWSEVRQYLDNEFRHLSDFIVELMTTRHQQILIWKLL